MKIAEAFDMLAGPDVDVEFVAYDGSKGGAIGSDVRLELKSPRAIAALLGAPGQLGLARAYVSGDLDVTGDSAETGKPQGSDERHGKHTYVSEHGLDGARRMAAEIHAQTRATLSSCAPAGAASLEAITDFIFTRTS